MSIDPRDILWHDSFITYYDSYFEELLSDRLIENWMRWDFYISTAVALTASGSALAGLTLWEKPEYKALWGIISVTVAVVGLIHNRLNVGELIKGHTKSYKDFESVRSQLEDFRRQLNLDPQFDPSAKNDEFIKLKKQYEAIEEIRDIAVTSGLKNKVKNDLNIIIKDQIQT